MASSQLPEDILLEILVRLPAKSLLRMHCVCKAWRDLFKNPYFIHKNATRNPSTVYLRSHCNKSELEYNEQLFEFNYDNPYVSRCVRIPDHNPYLGVRSSSCNGILCLEEPFLAFGGKVCLYNPTTRKDLTLPPSLFDDDIFYTHHVGFGFDKSCNDYKVIRVKCARRCPKMEDIRKRNLEEGKLFGIDMAEKGLLVEDLDGLTDYMMKRKHVEIYKFSTKRWIRLDVDLEMVVEKGFWLQPGGVLLNGFFHWMHGSTNKASILTFDFHAETFEEIELCDDLKFFIDQKMPNECRDLYVVALDDSLAVFSKTCIDDDNGILTIDVWVILEKYGNQSSWTKKFSVEIGKFEDITNTVGVHGQSLFLLCENYNNSKYVLVDFPLEDGGEGEGCKKLKARAVLEYGEYDNVTGVIFRPSLVPLPESEISTNDERSSYWVRQIHPLW